MDDNENENQPPQEELKFVGFMDVIQLHYVIKPDGYFEVHCHGLENYKHMNFAVETPQLFLMSAGRLITSLGDAVINKNDKFKANETCQWGEWGDFLLRKDKDVGGDPVLMIIPLTQVNDCEGCDNKKKCKGD